MTLTKDRAAIEPSALRMSSPVGLVGVETLIDDWQCGPSNAMDTLSAEIATAWASEREEEARMSVVPVGAFLRTHGDERNGE